MFKRRRARSFWQNIGEVFYPRIGWRRATSYTLHRLRRLPDSPHKIALGFSVGVFLTFTPLFGLHLLLAALLAHLLRGNVLAGLTGTFIGNPFTFPFISVGCYNMGVLLIGNGGQGHEAESVSQALGTFFSDLAYNLYAFLTGHETVWTGVSGVFRAVIVPYALGGVVIGLPLACVSYIVARPLVKAYQIRRRKRLMAKAVQRSKAQKQEAQKQEIKGEM